jgi:large repetitive protein
MRRVALDSPPSPSKHVTDDNRRRELHRMSRREFIALAVAGSGAWPFTALAQSQWSESVLGSIPAGLWPDAGNTGTSKGIVLTSVRGDVTITKAGTIYEGKDVKGTIWVRADNVTIQNCRVTSNADYGIECSERKGVVIQDCTIIGSDGNGNNNQVGGADGINGGGQFLRNNISGFENGITLIEVGGQVVTAQDNYIHDLGGNPDAHVDGIQTAGSNMLIKHNAILSWDTSCVFIKNDWGPVDNITVDGNLLLNQPGRRCAYTVYSYQIEDKGAVTNISFINNVIERGRWGHASIVNNSPVWSGNTDLITKRPIARPPIERS